MQIITAINGKKVTVKESSDLEEVINDAVQEILYQVIDPDLLLGIPEIFENLGERALSFLELRTESLRCFCEESEKLLAKIYGVKTSE